MTRALLAFVLLRAACGDATPGGYDFNRGCEQVQVVELDLGGSAQCPTWPGPPPFALYGPIAGHGSGYHCAPIAGLCWKIAMGDVNCPYPKVAAFVTLPAAVLDGPIDERGIYPVFMPEMVSDRAFRITAACISP